MSNFIPLEDIRIARPCRADWDKMTGDERARFCGSCHKNVYDISQLTREEAHQLIARNEGNLCIRLYRRPDGTVITSDCPVGKRETMRPMWWTLAGFVALLASGVAVRSQPAAKPICPVPVATTPTPLVARARTWPVVGAAIRCVSPTPQPLMGEVAFAPPVMGKPAPPRVQMGAPMPPSAPAKTKAKTTKSKTTKTKAAKSKKAAAKRAAKRRG